MMGLKLGQTEKFKSIFRFAAVRYYMTLFFWYIEHKVPNKIESKTSFFLIQQVTQHTRLLRFSTMKKHLSLFILKKLPDMHLGSLQA